MKGCSMEATGNKWIKRKAGAILLGLWTASTAFITMAGIQLNDQVDVTVSVLPGGESFISISAAEVAWTNVVIPGVMDRINSPRLTCNFFPAGGPWQIKVFHTNTTSALAMQGVGVTNRLLVRLWQPNLGPTNYYALGYMPDPMDVNVWCKGSIVGPAAFPGLFARQASGDYPPVDFHFMINARQVPAADYEGTIFFELQTP